MAGRAPRDKRDHKALIKGAGLPERSVPICLHADLRARMEDLERDLQTAEKAREDAGSSLASGGESHRIANEIEQLREHMIEHTLTFRLRALPRRRWTSLQVDFPPRDGNTHDTVAGVNIDAFGDALVRACVFEPEMDDEDWANLDDALSDGQWQQLANAAWAINAREVYVPFSRSASRIIRASADE